MDFFEHKIFLRDNFWIFNMNIFGTKLVLKT